ncbi:monovalent cation/H+ antiporter subunit D family protein [Serpentinicella sp. ANB-PHB4]|uniref:complex I subunit 5 family protein n=1 Tax=Serpentinicella sp. ANB-PHB4 TaxID=3074076 RepID=UPI00285C6DDA|nr:monovalent cation/H+ antiporter subunit D family protein [Serpentinicella sp. ANB-PHB4]MDR5659343.1 monovalent cation/H+ antiporter subunit D family protein [Serpentinicella sp. ANB-PHB4]
MQFPLYVLLLLLMGSVIIPLTTEKFNMKAKTVILGTLVLSWGMMLSTFINVLREGPYLYNIGNWGPKIGIQFNIDIFSTSMSLFILSLSILVIIYSLKDIEHEIYFKQISVYYSLVLLLILGMVGITVTNDLFNTYVFMEILAITSCAIISIKRKKENYMASFRYLILNTLGSLSFLFGVALLYMVTGYLNMSEIYIRINQVWELYPTNLLLALGLMLTGLGIKAAVFPLHVWLPDAHSTAPTPSSALLSGLVVKVYIFTAMKLLFRVIGLEIIDTINIPSFITYFAVVGMIMGSVFAIGQRDIKRLLAYSSVAQIGYIFLGVGLATELGLSAGLFHVVSHGFMKSLLFLSAGAIIYKTGKRDIRTFKGIGYQMPLTMILFTVGALGMIGIPGLNGFMSKWYLGFAVLEKGQPIYLIVILLSSFLNAIYYLPIIISAFLTEGEERNIMVLEDIPKTMSIPMVLIASFCIITGFFPQIVMDVVSRAIPTFL